MRLLLGLFSVLILALSTTPALAADDSNQLNHYSRIPSDEEHAFQTASSFPVSPLSSTSSSSPLSDPPVEPIGPAVHNVGLNRGSTRVVYPDEDPADAHLAWFRAKAEKEPGKGWKYIEGPLMHPSEQFDWGKWRIAPDERDETPHAEEAKGREEEKVKPVFRFTAGEKGNEKEGEGEVPVERLSGNLMSDKEQEEGGEGEGRGGSPAASIGGRRRTARFNEAGMRRIGVGTGSRRHIPRPLTPPAANVDTSIGGGERDTSPTRQALNSAKAKLEALSPHHPPSYPSEPSNPASPANSLTDNHGDSTPPSSSSHLSEDRISSWLRSTLPPPTSHPSSSSPKLAPYRLWSIPQALPSINLYGYKKLSDRYPPSFAHWTQSLSTLRTMDFTDTWSNSLQWAHDHRIDSTRSARILNPLTGGVLGSDVTTAPPRFINDPEHPQPIMESYELTLRDKRLHALRELAELVPPALTGHSEEIFNKHSENGWNEIGKNVGFHEKLHPIQYVSQMLRDKNAAIILENAIHDKLHNDLANTPKKVIDGLRTLRRAERSKVVASGGSEEEAGGGRKGKESLEKLLGKDYAVHNKFWYNYYKEKPAFRIRNPLHTPLEEFSSFRDFADAVALRKP